MGQQSETDAWTTPVYNLSPQEDEGKSEYEYELIEGYKGDYIQLYSASKYGIEIPEVEIETEPQTVMEILNDTFSPEKRKYQP
jgi:hypothetical protein